MNNIRLIIIVLIISVLSSCNKENKSWENESVEIKIDRLDQDLYYLNFDSLYYEIDLLNNKYGDFFELYNQRVLKVGSSNSKSYGEYLQGKINDYFIHQLYKELNNKFQDINWLESELTNAFKRYSMHFPGEYIPHIVTFMGGLNQSIVVTDSILAIGLDKYLGSDFEMYLSAGFYKYQIPKMIPEKIPSDALKAWASTEYYFDELESDLLAAMLYNGKLLYFVKTLLPEIEETVLMGYEEQEIKWCEYNQWAIWEYLIDEKLLFSTNYKVNQKLTADAPFTALFNRESPARAVNWLGLKIIESYMKHNADVNLKTLMEDNNYQLILKKSKFKG